MANKTINEHVAAAVGDIELSAKAFVDHGFKQYKAEMHQAACGRAFANRFADGMEPTAENCKALFRALHNHSAWTKRLITAGIVPEQNMAAQVDDYLNLLEKEGV